MRPVAVSADVRHQRTLAPEEALVLAVLCYEVEDPGVPYVYHELARRCQPVVIIQALDSLREIGMIMQPVQSATGRVHRMYHGVTELGEMSILGQRQRVLAECDRRASIHAGRMQEMVEYYAIIRERLEAIIPESETAAAPAWNPGGVDGESDTRAPSPVDLAGWRNQRRIQQDQPSPTPIMPASDEPSGERFVAKRVSSKSEFAQGVVRKPTRRVEPDPAALGEDDIDAD